MTAGENHERILVETFLDVPIYLEAGKFTADIEPPNDGKQRGVFGGLHAQTITRASLAAVKAELAKRKVVPKSEDDPIGPVPALVIYSTWGEPSHYQYHALVSYQQTKGGRYGYSKQQWRTDTGDLLDVSRSNIAALTPDSPEVRAKVDEFKERVRLLKKDWQAYVKDLPRLVPNANGRAVVEQKEKGHGD